MIQLSQFQNITYFCNTSLLIYIIKKDTTFDRYEHHFKKPTHNKIVVVWEKKNKAKAREQSKRERISSLL